MTHFPNRRRYIEKLNNLKEENEGKVNFISSFHANYALELFRFFVKDLKNTGYVMLRERILLYYILLSFFRDNVCTRVCSFITRVCKHISLMAKEENEDENLSKIAVLPPPFFDFIVPRPLCSPREFTWMCITNNRWECPFVSP